MITRPITWCSPRRSSRWVSSRDDAPNVIIVLMSIELMLNAVNINLIAFSHQLQNAVGQVSRSSSSSSPRRRPPSAWASFSRSTATRKRQHRRNEPAAVVSGMDLIWLIPCCRLGASSTASSRPLLQQADRRLLANATLAAALLLSLYAFWQLLGLPPRAANTPSA